MTLEEVKNFIEENKGTEEVKEYLEGFKGDNSLEAFKEKISTDSSFISFMDREKDKHTSRALETWKSNNLDSLIDQEVKTRFPEKDEKDIALQDLQAQFDNMANEKKREGLMNVALKKATELGLPVEYVDFLIADDEETTVDNVEKIHKSFESVVESELQAKLKGKGDFIPNKRQQSETQSIGERLAKKKAESDEGSVKDQDHYFKQS